VKSGKKSKSRQKSKEKITNGNVTVNYLNNLKAGEENVTR